MQNDSILAITVNQVNYDKSNAGYFRVSIYEFKGDPLVAYFKEDLGYGSWYYDKAVEWAKDCSKVRDIIFVPNISMGNSVKKVFDEALK